jgi:hypothetical protein
VRRLATPVEVAAFLQIPVKTAALAFGRRQRRFQQGSCLFAEVEQAPHD